jgi:hypothetical protein
MDARDLFLFEHALAQSAAVGGNKTSVAENVFGGVTDEQMRVRPREDLNSLAWLMWHIARAEDIMVNPVLVGRDQVLDGGWLSRLRVGRKDFGIGMSKTEVSELTSQIDIGALREYRDAVGRRTRDIVSGFGAADWQGEMTEERMRAAAAQDAFGSRAEWLVTIWVGRPRLAVLCQLAVLHPMRHFGEAATVRTAGGFGSGI